MIRFSATFISWFAENGAYMIAKSFLIGGAMALLACAAQAGTLFTQPWDGSTLFYASQTGKAFFTPVSAIVYDDFHLDGPANVTGLDFTGAYIAGVPSTHMSGFAVSLYADNAGAPGAVISTSFLTTYSETYVTTLPFIDVFSYGLAFAPVALAAGDYWMSAVPQLEYAEWMMGVSATGNFNAIQTYNGATKQIEHNLAFDVIGERVAGDGGVPEPATWALMLVGFGLAGVGLRRRRSYSLVEIAADGTRSAEAFRAEDDQSALAQALSVAEGVALEVWRHNPVAQLRLG
jgi:hypothetical protein